MHGSFPLHRAAGRRKHAAAAANLACRQPTHTTNTTHDDEQPVVEPIANKQKCTRNKLHTTHTNTHSK